MSPSIVIRFAMAALATAFVLPAQSAPSPGTKPNQGQAETKAPNQAQAETKADEKVQTRLAEVIAMLEEDDLSPEQRAEAKKKLKEIVTRLRRSSDASPLLVPSSTAGDPAAVEVSPRREGRQVELRGRQVKLRYPADRADVAVPVPPAPDVAPAPPRAPKAPRAPRAPRVASGTAPAEAPAAPEAPPGVWLVAPETAEAAEVAPLPGSRPRATRSRVVETRLVPVEVVEGEAVEVEAVEPAESMRLPGARGSFEAARAEAYGHALRVQGLALDQDRAKLYELHEREVGEHARAHLDAARAQLDAERTHGWAKRYRAAAEEAKSEAAEVRARVVEVVRGEEVPVLRELPLLYSTRKRGEGDDFKGANRLFRSPVESRSTEAGDDEIRALIDEMRAEMRQIRALMQELRTRSDREEDADDGLGSLPGLGATNGDGAAGFGSRGSRSVAGFPVGGQQPAPSTTTGEPARRVRAVRSGLGGAGGGGLGGSAGFGGSAAPGGSGQSQGSGSSASAGGR